MIKNKGFTILEILVSLMIIGIIAGFGYNQFTKAMDTSKARGLEDDIQKLNSGIAQYFKTYSSYPDTIGNVELQKILIKDIGLNTNGQAINETSPETSTLKFLTGLGPRVYFDIRNDFAYEGNNAFRYIVVRNVPVNIAALVVKNINGVNNTSVSGDCQLVSKNWFAAATPRVTGATHNPNADSSSDDGKDTTNGGNYPSNNNCTNTETLTTVGGGTGGSANAVDLWFTFSRSIGTDSWN